ncbi:MAG: hypothetical protein JNL57_10160 [Bacteroidetes bacterium]|nr:hypothetical protein [Bacteroidota bacterium]
MKSKFLIPLLLLCATKVTAYTDVPALVNMNVSRQSDTMGFNIVYELQNLFYDLILQERVTLWDSPRKSTRITAATLQAIENSSGTKFNKSQNIFLHEFWSSTRRRTSFTIVGISFINDGKQGKVSYGYCDLAEVWSILSNTDMPTNVNGPARLTYSQALYSRNYNFNLVQFGRKKFTNKPEESLDIRDKAFFSKREVEGLYRIPTNKYIQYLIEPDLDDTKEIGNVLFANLQEFLNQNREVLLNIGGDKYFDYKNFKSEVSVTRIEVNEIWEKKPGFVDYKVQNLVIYVNNKPLDPVGLDVVLNWGVLYNFKTVEDVLKEKAFRYTLLRMNSTFITDTDSPKFLKALEKYSWTQVSRYVKFY